MQWTIKRTIKVMIPIIGAFIISVKEWDSIDDPNIEILFAAYHSIFVMIPILMISTK